MRTTLVIAAAAGGLALTAPCTAYAAPSPAADVLAAAPSTWRATIEGGVSRTRERDTGDEDPARRVVTSARDAYRSSIRMTFTVRADGSVAGSGSGEYTVALWHLQGTNGDRGSFSCDPVIQAAPFGVVVSGRMHGGRVVLDVRLDAREHNDDLDCGADFTAYATDSTYLADSWAAVGGHALAFDPAAPRVPVLRLSQWTGDPTDQRAAEHEWRVVLERLDRGAGPGEDDDDEDTPPRLGPPPPRSQCTITGTPGDDVLRGTSGPDVICGLAGDDRLAALGGDDVVVAGAGDDVAVGGRGHDRVYGGAGRDRIAVRDGALDRVAGGPGRDRATVDRSVDRTIGVEVVA